MSNTFAASIERFCYIGSLRPSYTRKKGLIDLAYNVHDLLPILETCEGELFSNIIEKCLKSNLLPRKDEVWFLFALYLASKQKPENKILVYRLLPKFAKTAEDLFLFANYSSRINRSNGRKGLTKTTRKAICRWYKEQRANDLVEMLGEHRGMHGWTHKDLICLSHVSFRHLEDHDIITSLFTRGCKMIKMTENKELKPTTQRAIQIFKLKICENVNDAKEIITTNQLRFENVPSHLLHKIDIWNAVLPTIPYKDLLKHIHTLNDMKVLHQTAFNKKLVKIISNGKNVEDAKIHPLAIFICLRKHEKQMRYSESIKLSFYKKKLEKLKVKPNLFLIKGLQSAFNHAFGCVERLGIRTMVTINLQKNYTKKKVFGLKQVTCVEASVLLALSIFRVEKNTTITTFSNDSQSLAVVSWPKGVTFDKANQICETYVKDKTCQRVYLPLIEYSKKPEVFDLFLVIVPSAARGNPNNRPPYEQLKHYRESKNKNARMIIINLRRHKPAMIHEMSEDNGILEICGIDEDTPHLIKAFVNSYFK